MHVEQCNDEEGDRSGLDMTINPVTSWLLATNVVDRFDNRVVTQV
jgi:hypothetical protein